ncbi:MAG: hypothetical protein HYT20_00615 [Candidatus Nealsonbacteria bacterium]|nr:hypothetical protein [Candidatus Nealsonbacteria bacterium]
MRQLPRKEVHYGKEVWVNPVTEKIRKHECLCLHCDRLKPAQPDNCKIAQNFYQICVQENVALAVTRCPLFVQK